jgi:transcriptional regulator with XRE-family HTH domain
MSEQTPEMPKQARMDFLWHRAAELGLTQVALAKRLGVDESEVSFLKTGRHLPSRYTIQKILYEFPELTAQVNQFLVFLEHEDRQKEGQSNA